VAKALSEDMLQDALII